MPKGKTLRKRPADERSGRSRQDTPPTEETPEVMVRPEASQEASLERQSSRSSSAASTASGASVAQSQQQKKKRAKRTEFTLNTEQEKAMCEFLQENPILWDTKLINYRRSDLKSKLWEDQATKLEKTVEHLKGWFKSLRDSHTRLDKKKSGAGLSELTERDQWIVKSFEFLKSVVRHRSEPVRSMRVADDLIASEIAVTSMDDEPQSTSSSTRQAQNKRGKTEEHDMLLVSLQKQVEESGEILKDLSQPKKITSTTAFANYVRDSLISMSKNKFKKARSQINKVLTDLLEQDSGDEDLPTVPAVVNSARCTSATTYATYSYNSSSNSEPYQPPPHVWRHRAPITSVWQSDYVQNYLQEPLLPAFQQQSLQQQQQQQQQTRQQPQESPQSMQPLQPPVNQQPPAVAAGPERQLQASISSVISSAQQTIEQGTNSPAAVTANQDAELFNLSTISGFSTGTNMSMSDIFHSSALASTPAKAGKLETPPGSIAKK